MDALYANLERFSGLSAKNIQLFCTAAISIKVKKDNYLLKEGIICKDIWFIVKGYCRSFYLHDGREINTAFNFENSYVTDIKSLRLELPAESSIVAAEDGLLYKFTKQKMLDIYKESKEIVEFGKKLIEQLLINEQENTNLFRLYSAEERYTYLLRNNPAIIQRVPLNQLASYLGMARETLSRMRKMKGKKQK